MRRNKKEMMLLQGMAFTGSEGINSKELHGINSKELHGIMLLEPVMIL